MPMKCSSGSTPESPRSARFAAEPRSSVPTFCSHLSEFDPAGVIPKGQLFVMDRVAQMAVVAAQRALAASGLLVEGRGPADAGIYMGCGLGGSNAIQDAYRTYYQRQSRKLKPTLGPADHGERAGQPYLDALWDSRSVAHLFDRVLVIGHRHRRGISRDPRRLSGLALWRVAPESMLNDGTIAAWEGIGRARKGASGWPGGVESTVR